METLRNNSEEKEVEEEKEKKENIRVCKWESVKKKIKGKEPRTLQRSKDF